MAPDFRGSGRGSLVIDSCAKTMLNSSFKMDHPILLSTQNHLMILRDQALAILNKDSQDIKNLCLFCHPKPEKDVNVKKMGIIPCSEPTSYPSFGSMMFLSQWSNMDFFPAWTIIPVSKWLMTMMVVLPNGPNGLYTGVLTGMIPQVEGISILRAKKHDLQTHQARTKMASPQNIRTRNRSPHPAFGFCLA